MVVNIKTATFVVVIACSLPGAYCTSTYEQLISSVIRLEVFFFSPKSWCLPDQMAYIIRDYMLIKLCFESSVPSYLSHRIFPLFQEGSHIHIL
jgi:hypothetical protein